MKNSRKENDHLKMRTGVTRQLNNVIKAER
jgi:hypothetical protein